MSETDYDDACKYEYIKALGPASNDCVVLGYRTLYGFPFSDLEMESWLIHFKPSGPEGKELATLYKYGNACWLTGLWRSKTGVVYVSDGEGFIRTWRDLEPRPGETSWEEVKLEARLHGVWGLSDDCIYTWGRAGETYRMFRYDGRTWNPMPSPGHLSVLRGLSPDFLYAVGYDGMMARWDGHSWTPVRTPVRSNFMGLFIAGPDELYATTEGGELWEGTSHGWSKRSGLEDPLLDVAKFNGEVWVAGGEEGLFKLKAHTQELECAKPNIKATSFAIDGRLIVTTPDIIYHSADGLKFAGYGRGALRHFRGTQPRMWEPGA